MCSSENIGDVSSSSTPKFWLHCLVAMFCFFVRCFRRVCCCAISHFLQVLVSLIKAREVVCCSLSPPPPHHQTGFFFFLRLVDGLSPFSICTSIVALPRPVLFLLFVILFFHTYFTVVCVFCCFGPPNLRLPL